MEEKRKYIRQIMRKETRQILQFLQNFFLNNYSQDLVMEVTHNHKSNRYKSGRYFKLSFLREDIRHLVEYDDELQDMFFDFFTNLGDGHKKGFLMFKKSVDTAILVFFKKEKKDVLQQCCGEKIYCHEYIEHPKNKIITFYFHK